MTLVASQSWYKLYSPVQHTQNPHNPFINPNRSHVVTQTQAEDPLELFTHANAVTETDDFIQTVVDTSFHKYLDDTFTGHIAAASLTPNKHTTTPIINFPPKDRFRFSSSQLTEVINLIKCDGTHLFQSNSHSKACQLDRAFLYLSLLSFMHDKKINDSIV